MYKLIAAEIDDICRVVGDDSFSTDFQLQRSEILARLSRSQLPILSSFGHQYFSRIQGLEQDPRDIVTKVKAFLSPENLAQKYDPTLKTETQILRHPYDAVRSTFRRFVTGERIAPDGVSLYQAARLLVAGFGNKADETPHSPHLETN